MTSHANPYWDDILLLSQQLTEDERHIVAATRDFCQRELQPSVLTANRDAVFDPTIMRQFGQLGLLGATIPMAEREPISYVAYGLAAREVERVDSGYRSAFSVQSSLVMYPIYRFGSESLQQRLLPALSRGESIGCFG